MVESQQLNRGRRDVKNCLRSNESKLSSRIVGNDALHDNVVGRETAIEGNGLREQREELSCGHGLRSNPLIVEAISERNLDWRSSLGLGRWCLKGRNRLGESRGNARRGCGG